MERFQLNAFRITTAVLIHTNKQTIEQNPPPKTIPNPKPYSSITATSIL